MSCTVAFNFHPDNELEHINVQLFQRSLVALQTLVIIPCGFKSRNFVAIIIKLLDKSVIIFSQFV